MSKIKTLLIVGGATQGLEIAYLAGKLNVHRVMVDRKPLAAARSMVEEYHCFDVLKCKAEFEELMEQADWVIPAIEDLEVLEYIDGFKHTHSILFDYEAYVISESKKKSNDFMENIGILTSSSSQCKTNQYIAKPYVGSGSKDVRLLDEQDIEGFENKELYSIEPFLEGPSYSVEIIGDGSTYEAYQITEIIVDDSYDCKCVLSPCDIDEEIRLKIIEDAHTIAKSLSLSSIMDLEVIISGGVVYTLEIDARFPSQTPIVVYNSTGLNMVERLIAFEQPMQMHREKHVSYEQILVQGTKMQVLGEHIVKDAGPLQLITGFCCAHEAITNYAQGASEWMGIFIHRASSKVQLEKQKLETYAAIESLMATKDHKII